MRTQLTITMNTEMGNASVVDGTLQKVLETTMERLQPEAAYFRAEHGKRQALIFFDLKDSSEIPSIAEPLFQSFGADIEFVPVMNANDLERGLSQLEK